MREFSEATVCQNSRETTPLFHGQVLLRAMAKFYCTQIACVYSGQKYEKVPSVAGLRSQQAWLLPKGSKMHL